MGRAAAAFVALVALALGGCAPRPAEIAGPAPIATPCEEGAAPAPLSDDTIRLATFNIQTFGRTKRDKPEVMAVLVDVVRRYDLVAVQEIKDVRGETPGAFLHALNEAEEARYDMVVSPRSGATASASASEQYAYYYDTTTVAALDEGALYPDPDDAFVREPWVARFGAVGGRFTFVLLNVHTRPDAAVEEIGALHDAVVWARQRYPEEDDFIALGDFNASCDYASPGALDALTFRSEAYNWLIPDEADTNLAARPCAYDRIVVTPGANGDFTGQWGVDRAFADKAVSDHFPVWATFFSDRDGLTSCCKQCRVGKACGNACVARAAACVAPPGCACDGVRPGDDPTRRTRDGAP